MSTEGDYFTEVDVLCGPANTNLFNKANPQASFIK